MARTFGAILFYGAPNINLPTASQGVGAGQYAWVRNALGDVSLNNTAGVSTVQFWANLADIKRPYINFPAYPGQGTVPVSNEFQELYGASAGPGNPFSGGLSGSQFGTPALPWGMAIIDVFAIYSVLTATLTTCTIGVNRATYTENVAFTNTAVLPATGISTALTTGAGTPHVQKVSLAQPLVYETGDNSDVNIELLITTQATSAVRIYGIGAHVAYEFS